MSERIYLDNAATSFPKPAAVHEAMMDYARHIGASAGRGAYAEALKTGELMQRCRERIAQLIGCDQPQRLIFTLNCTDAINLVLRGLLHPGDHVVSSELDHNSILRPLRRLREQGVVETTLLRCDPRTGLLDIDEFRRAIKPNTKLLATLHASNVTGTVQPIERLIAIAHEYGVAVLVDAAQSAGHIPLDVKRLGADFVAFPGHKGLLGPLGTGVLYIAAGMEQQLQTVREGGTGSLSEQDAQPQLLPDKYEAGSHNAIGIIGLSEGVQYLLQRGIEDVRQHERQLCELFLTGTRDIRRLRLYGPRQLDRRVGVFSIRIDGYEPLQLALALEQGYGVLTRAGLHCAPLAHKTIGTFEAGGTTRISFGPFVTLRDVGVVVEALGELAAKNPA